MGQYPYYTNEPSQGASTARNDLPMHMSGAAQVNANPLAGVTFSPGNRNMRDTRTGSPEIHNVAESPLFELWQFIPKTNSHGGKLWTSPKMRLIPSDQITLEDLVINTEGKSVEDQYESLSKVRKRLVDQLIAERNQRDPRYEWTCVYIKTERQRIKLPSLPAQEVTAKMEVIVLRKPRHQTTGPGRFGNNRVSHADPRTIGDFDDPMNGRPAFQETSSPQPINASPVLPNTSRYGGPSANAGISPVHQQAYAQIHSPIYQQGQNSPSLPPNTQTLPHIHQSFQPTAHRQVHPQVYTQAQNQMPFESNNSFSGAPRTHATGHQGAPAISVADRYGQQIPHQQSQHVPPFGGIDPRAEAGAGKFNNEPRRSIHKIPAPADMHNSQQAKSGMRESPTRDAFPQHTRKNTAPGLPPKIIQQGHQPLHAKRTAYAQEDSSTMTEDESLFEETGYSSASSMDSFPKGSLHRQKTTGNRAMNDREHRSHNQKRYSKDRGHTIYPANTANTYQSVSSPRRRENERLAAMDRRDYPVTAREERSDPRVPGLAGLAELALNSNEASYMLFKMQEQQKHIMNQLERLEIRPQTGESLNHAGRELAIRGIESDLPMVGRRIYYEEPSSPTIRRTLSYVPREIPFICERYI